MKLRVLAMLVGMTLLPTGAGAGTGETYLVEVFSNAGISVQPGLCVAGDTPDCVGPSVAQFRFISDVCTVNGRFEGADLPVGATCSFRLYGFQYGLAPGTKPVCGGTRFVTSNATTAFGANKLNKFTVNGVARNITVEGYSLGLTFVLTKAEWDDADADTNPQGDHVSVSPPTPVQRGSSSPGIPCVTTPLDIATAPGGVVLHQ